MADTIGRSAARAKGAAAPVSDEAPVGISIHVGLNAVNVRHYCGWTGELASAGADAMAMAAIATTSGIQPKLLLSRDATRAKVLTAIRHAARALRPRDLFFLSFSGCGGQIPDYTGEEADRLSETWCLYDAQLIEDELFLELTRFQAGTRLLLVQDTSYSGTVTRAVPLPTPERGATRLKLAPDSVALKTYREHKAFYAKLQSDVARRRSRSGTAAVSTDTAAHGAARPDEDIGPAVIVMAAAQDNQTAIDGDRNGLFTAHLLDAWRDGKFQGDYMALIQRIRATMPSSQSPEIVTRGDARAFLRERPFSVGYARP